ncbi:hypothetical protein D910_07044 [Dendroctonus ponderosae]|uniref:DNA ligase 4 n=1 Tax=Dendroctonus ponderosae TaxID=77166 RepID=U4UGE6_DENPD|nr:hypothetical protein D910_07044 [Dendroctonus ponderosae]
MDFKELCGLFNAVKDAKAAATKRKLVEECFSAWRSKHSKQCMFSILRLIVPKLDRERDSYGLQEKKISRILIKMLALPKNTQQMLSIQDGCLPVGDYADMVYSVIHSYISQYKTTLTVLELNKCLDDIVARTNEAQVEEIVMKLFKKCSAEDSKWIIRIILKRLKLSIDENQILNCYHKDGAHYYLSGSNLRKVCEVLYDKNINVHELDIEIFQPFRPMLSKRVDAAVFKKHFTNNKPFYIENKFDGERFQVHMQNGAFKYFSRQAFDFTRLLTPKLKNLFQPFVQRIILDGEMMLWNRYTNKYGSKGMELDVKKLKKDGKYQPCFCVYDIILLNDQLLTNRPLKERLAMLGRVFKSQVPGTLIVSELSKVGTAEEIVDALNNAVDKEEEGIIVKDPTSVYKYSDRNSGWFKLKLEYFQDTMHDLDVVVMGGKRASSTSSQLNSFIVGVQSGTTKTGGPLFLSFAKVSSGLSDEQLHDLNSRFKTHGKLFDSNNHSSALVFGSEVPHYFIEPADSVVFVIRATELTRINNASYKTSYTLRFPRVLKVRTDKPINECLDMNQLLELAKQNKSVIKLNKRYIELDEILQIQTRRRKKRKIEVVKFESTRQISDLLEGYLFHVLNGDKDQLEALVRRAGGKVHYKIDHQVDIVLVADYNAKAMEICKRRNHCDVIDAAWLRRVVQEGDLLPYKTLEIYCLGTSIKNCLSDATDRYGDSYTQEATMETLKHSVTLLRNLGEQPCFGQLLEIPPEKTFAPFKAFFDTHSDLENENSAVIYESLEDELEFKYYYGEVERCNRITADTNMVITNDWQRLDCIKEHLQRIHREDVEIRHRSFLYE